ncbi:cytochrome c7 [Geomesophilobacter sediminis]|uniref:Cytochrome c3 family protein n=1 Tax=Geomesophilobacter sediminis TaxID=2798584 RepID=A0A8J7M080_9BACT|nr:cytochrome c7 [Geomesophilobacter sediminis]MBJ6723792.1 cytochrome c3 family protein [Geomesophilobacter sediminis]
MKKAFFALAGVIFYAGLAQAADVVELPASMGKVTFPHKKHQEMLRDCTKCHEKGPGKIAELGKEWAHRTCKGCHTQLGRGPTACKDCHKK